MMKRIDTLLLLMIFSGCLMAQPTDTGCTCCSEPYRQFDFWHGNWKVTAGEKFAGENVITFIQDSCVLREEWTSAGGGYTGTSYNFYDLKTDSWNQVWVDNQGGHLLLKGGMDNGSMVLKSAEVKNREGKYVVHRITWTPHEDGSVRQHWQYTPAEKEEWQTLFDGLYKRI